MSTRWVGAVMPEDTHDFELRPQDENVQCRAREEDYGADRRRHAGSCYTRASRRMVGTFPPVKIITLCFLRHTFYAGQLQAGVTELTIHIISQQQHWRKLLLLGVVVLFVCT